MKTTLALMGMLTASLLGNIWAFWRVVRPVRQLASRAAQLAQGDMTALEESCDGIREVSEIQHTMATMAQHVQRAQVEGITYRHALTDGQEAERSRIAHELHDDTVQSLIAIAQSMEMVTGWIDTDPQRAKDMLGLARTQAVESVHNLRRLIADLRPPALEELGITAALQMMSVSSASLQISVNVSGLVRRISPAHELALFRIAQEALRNTEKHARASHITLSLVFKTDAVHLTVQDDGIGFHRPSSLDVMAQQQHFGLLGIQERAQQLNGTFKITSERGHGTTLEVVLPLNAADQPAQQVRDPVCGALIQPHKAFGSTIYADEHYYFCCPVCQGAFLRQPEHYAIIRTPGA